MLKKPPISLTVNIAEQRLYCRQGADLLCQYAIASAAKGVGERLGSEQTPRGRHIIRACIGKDAPLNTVFVSRRPTGEIYSPALAAAHPHRDWILTRILWLSGKEIGKNRLGEVDTFQRFIYIHGCPDTIPMGEPGSHGCIRMRNRDIVALFNQVCAGTPINIVET